MANEKVQLREAIKKAEANLYKISKQAEEAEKFNSMLKEVYDSLLLMERITEENPALNSIVSEAIKEKKLVSLYKKMEETLEKTRTGINSFEDHETRTKLFLENFRTNRTYYFNNFDSMTDFIKQAYPLFSISRVVFKPEFIGTVKLDSIAETIKEEAKGNQELSIPTEKINELIELIEKKGMLKNSRIENELLKIVLKGNNEISVDSDNSRIRRLDRLCKQFDGNWKEE
ncbi:hypothetical protein KKG83_06645 [Candidatus Micrarchaeota archaeon]|nr:hypothetical protein [Candidatus Micrarchaeota archaeon]MBU2477122.1 hypothetical protein [Candidatus Micrarchaeota archaeon]